MYFRQVLPWLLGYEGFTLVMSYFSVRKPRLDPLDGSSIPSDLDVIVSVHIYAYVFLLAITIFLFVFMRLWKSSTRRR